MLFNSYEFLFLFLPIFGLGYLLLRRSSALPLWLVAASYLFYGWWDWRFCGLLAASTAVDFLTGREAGRPGASPRRRRTAVVISCVSNLGLLGFFKYFDLAAATVNRVAAWTGADHPLLPLLGITLPVGISFYTFQSMSYTIDIYLGAARPARRFRDFAAYVALFPQLVAGPIVRYRELADQLHTRTHSWAKAALGMNFLVLGLAKKVVLADAAATLVPLAFGPDASGALAAWTGLVAYSVQIYFDFSGYSDMAVGLGLLIGFQFPQNFDSPYRAVSITDFWRRWHMSLSAWLRDYLYIPLGGNRKGPGRTYVNLFLTMLLGGLWHGAQWTFVVWGGIHGLLLAAERRMGRRGLLAAAPKPVQIAATFLLVTLAWVPFRADSMSHALAIFASLFGADGWGALPAGPWFAVPLLALALGLTWACPNTWRIRWTFPWWYALLLAALFGFCVLVILVNTSSPFLYFQF